LLRPAAPETEANLLKIFARLLPLALLCHLFSGNAGAQQSDRPPNLNLGDAVVTGFSGTIAPDPAKPRPANKSAIDLTFINPDGPSARIVGVGRPGFVWDGRFLPTPRTFDVFAKDVGQVFGVALDDQQPASNIYLAATSAFGLNLVGRGAGGQPERRKTGGPGAGWMKGQFGLDLQGDPGSIYKVDGTTGVVSLFAKVMLDGVPNPGAALGNLAYDAAHKQLLVSDLYTGMIHRFAIADGSEPGAPYDHGVSGRGAANLAPMPFNPAGRPNIASTSFNSENPDTWGFAPPERRVWGIAVQAGRLFYSAGNGSMTEAPQIWSVGIAQDGSLGTDARLELDVTAQPGPYPVSDIAFSQSGAMIVAQRAPIAASYDYSAFTKTGEPRVLRYWLKDANDPPSPGLWKPLPEEYAIGFAGTYRNTDGGVALGYGYGPDGMINTGSCEAALWTTGQNLRNNPALRAQLEPGGPLLVNGLQGSPADMVRSANEPPAISYFVDYDDRFDDPRASGHMGSVRILARPCAGQVADSGPSQAGSSSSGPRYVSGPQTPTTTTTTTTSDCPAGQNPDGTCGPIRIDLAIKKTSSEGKYDSASGTWTFQFTLSVANVGNPFFAQNYIAINDPVPAGLTFTAAAGSNWNCPAGQFPATNPNALNCTYNFGAGQIATGQVLAPLVITVSVKNAGKYENCATTGINGAPWLQETTLANNKSCVTIAVPVDLALTKTAGAAVYDEKTGLWTISFKIDVTNAGSPFAPGNSISIDDPIPAGLTFVSGVGTGWTCAGSAGNIHCGYNFGSGVFNHGGHLNQLVLTFTTKTPGIYENCASVAVATGSGFTESTLGNNKGCDKVEVKYPPNNVTVTKVSPSAPCAVESACTFQIVVTNNSPWPFNGPITVSDNAGVPMNIASTDLPCNPVPAAIPFSCTALVSLPPGVSSATYTIVGVIAAGTIPLTTVNEKNCAVITQAPPISGFPSTIVVPPGPDCKPYTACGFACHMTQPQIDQIKIEKKANATQCSPGGLCSYTFTITNLSTTNATSTFPIAFIDTMPAGATTFVPPPVPAPWTCLPLGGNPDKIKCLYPPSSIPAGGHLTVVVTFQIAPNYAAATLQNCSEFYIGQPAMAAAQQRARSAMDESTLRSYLQSRGIAALPAALASPVLNPDDKSCTTVQIVKDTKSCPPGTVLVGNECVKQDTSCKLPLVPGPVAGQCVCSPSGTVLVDGKCVKQETACKLPLVPGPVAGQSVCSPPGTVLVEGKCVKQETSCKSPLVPGPVAGQCVCSPPGTVLVDGKCVKQDTCKRPMVPRPVAGQCVCSPPGTVLVNGKCVKLDTCRPPMVPGPVAGHCVCSPPGTVLVNGKCVTHETCRPPARLNRRGDCECPQDMVARGNSCVEREHPPSPPGITPRDPRGGRDDDPRGGAHVGEPPHGGPRGGGGGAAPPGGPAPDLPGRR
jgi:uncharacterized repeat protein (TIGR01451 family)